MDRQGFREKWKRPKKDQIMIGILVGVLLLVIALPQGKEETVRQAAGTALQEEAGGEEGIEEKLERKLQRVLEQVEGVGKVRVMITLKSYGKRTVEKDTAVSEDQSGAAEGEGSASKRTEESTVFERDSQGNEIPFVTEETAAQVAGVLVAAQGGDNLAVAENIADAAGVLFGVEAHKIKVMKLN